MREDIKSEMHKTFLSCLSSTINCLKDFEKEFSHSIPIWLIETIELMIETKNNKGYIVTSGIGKSGYIAQKMSATLSSLGFPSFYVHPSEASHGDLGRLTNDSLVIIFSKSGESKELEDLLLYCNSKNIKVVSITSNVFSLLANNSNVVIPFEVKEEACHMNIAPTNSTTISLVIADSLSVTASKFIEFTKEDFKKLHPGGKIGISLLKISDIMTPIDNVSAVLPEDNLSTVIISMTSLRQNACAVIEKENNCNYIIGLITDFDIRKTLSLNNGNITNIKSKDIMNKNFFFVEEGMFAGDVLKVMTKKRYNVAPVIKHDNGRMILRGVIHISKLIEIGLEIN